MLDLNSIRLSSCSLLRAESDRGRAWISWKLGDDALTYGDAITVEPRRIADILYGAHGDGLTIGIDGKPVEPA